MKRGVIYYNKGDKMIARLAVSVSSLRKIYNGPCCIISEGYISNESCKKIADRFKCEFLEVEHNRVEGKNHVLLNKTLMHESSPYDVSLFLDSDTIIKGDFSQLFVGALKYKFCVAHFAGWGTNGKMRKRIMVWKDIYPDWMQPAIEYGKAVNTGVFAFCKDSKLMIDWFDKAIKGQLTRIPDEICCQLMLPHYSHKMTSQKYNVSCCKSDPYDSDVRIIHFHGNKHCRMFDNKPIYGADLWYKEFDEIKDFIEKDWIKSDRMLRKNLLIWEAHSGL